MKEFTVSVKEILCRSVQVEAATEEEALEKVMEMYNDEKIVLEPHDYFDTEFSIEDDI